MQCCNWYMRVIAQLVTLQDKWRHDLRLFCLHKKGTAGKPAVPYISFY